MATAASTNLEDVLNCTICLDTFTKPKVLPCLHTFCYSCLVLLGKDKSSLKCPLCQEDHQIPGSGISGFKDNFLLAKLLDVPLPKLEVCVDCGEKSTAVNECEHCGQKLCFKCVVQHLKLSMELSVSLKQLEDDMKTPASKDRMVNFETFRANVEAGRKKMIQVLNSEANKKLMEVKTLLERANYLDRLMRMTCRIYDALGHGDLNSEKQDDSYVSELLARKPSECTSVSSLTNFKNNLDDFKTLLRLIKTKDGEFRFNYTTDAQDGLEQVEFEGAVVDIKGKYPNSNILEQIGGLLGETKDDLQHAHYAHPSSNMVAPVAAQPEPRVTALRKYHQNQLPRHLDYKSIANDGSDVVVVEGQSPENQLNYPRACSYHVEKDLLFVEDLQKQRILVFGGDGKKGRVFYQGVKQPRDLAVSTDGKYLFIAAGGSLVKVNMKGELVKTIKQFTATGYHGYQKFRSVTCYQEFTVVLDKQHKGVAVYNDRDEWVKLVSCSDNLKLPVAVAVSDDKMFYIADEKTSCVHIYNWTGDYLGHFAALDTDYDIRGIAVDGESNVYISRYNSDRIDIYNRQQQPVTSIGSPGNELEVGKFHRPRGLCLTADGKLVVVDCYNHRVQIIRVKEKVAKKA